MEPLCLVHTGQIRGSPSIPVPIFLRCYSVCDNHWEQVYRGLIMVEFGLCPRKGHCKQGFVLEALRGMSYVDVIAEWPAPTRY